MVLTTLFSVHSTSRQKYNEKFKIIVNELPQAMTKTYFMCFFDCKDLIVILILVSKTIIIEI